MNRALLLLILVGLLGSLAVLAQRWGVEARYQVVELILDGLDWEALATKEGRDPVAFLVATRAAGATSAAVYERTLKRMAQRGEVAYLSLEQILAEARVRPLAPVFRDLIARGEGRSQAVYVNGPPEMLGFLAEAYSGILGSTRVRRAGSLLEISGLLPDIEEIGLGYLPHDLDRYTRIGLQPALRVRNYPGLTAEGLQRSMARLAQLGRGYTVVFELTEVLGFERLIDETAAALRSAGNRYGRIEVFSAKRKQRGDDRLAKRMRPEVIRLFSLTPEELQVLDPTEAREKFVRAARERNIRLLYLRPIGTSAGVTGTAANLAFLGGLAGDLRRVGLQPGHPQPLPELEVPLVLFLGITVGVFAAIGLVMMMLGEAVGALVPARWILILVLAGLILTLVLAITGPLALWRKLLALGTAAAVPAGAVAVTLPRARPRGPLAQGLRSLWLAAAISAAGGVLVAALLTEWNFMMAADVFLGVKLAHVIPVALATLLVWRQERPLQDWREGTREIWRWSSQPLLLRYAIVVLLAGLAAAILLGRSGNFGLPVLGPEERLRGLVENLLVARPRTKEYLVGHPALMVAAVAAAMGWRRWVLPLAAVGAIGQAGIVNSFSHIHTPLLYTVWRTINALVLGSLLGALAAGVLLTVFTRGGGRRRS